MTVPRRILVVLGAMALLMAVPVPAHASSDLRVPDEVATDIADAKKARTYLVVTTNDPVVAYEGDVPGYAATRPAEGQKVDRDAARVQRYTALLESRHDDVLARAGAEPDAKLYDYTFAVSGFAARLTEAEVTALSAQPEVSMVVPDRRRQLHTDNSPEFLGLDSRGGPWSRFDGSGVVVGVIDTGIWPEHPSFADTGYPAPPSGFAGTGCDFGNTAFNPNDDAFTCNNKLLAAKSYVTGFLGGEDPATVLAPGSHLSARDEDGHGTHTSSTAAGNAGIPASILGADRGVVSGIAPRAHVSVYKACWDETPEVGGCAFSDLVAAIDDAVGDGVDVINYSIGSDTAAIGPDDISFLFAADAGVYVATSAGNAGPGAGTVGSPASVPWLTAVGASTQNRTFQGSVSSSDGGWEFFGASVTGGTDEVGIVDAADAGNELCLLDGTLDASVVSGKIVLCLRGVNARVAKSQAVFEAGGVGMVLYNAVDPQTQNTDNHWVPTVHVTNADGLVIKDYIATAADPVAQINGGEFTPIDAPWMADFSSRGSNQLSSDIIKPDVTAPGVNILAGNSPVALLGAPDQLFQAISGTSMSSPHVAGVLALIKEAHRTWSPEAAKSALMTTAYQDVAKEDGVTPADPFDMGAGHIDPAGRALKGSAFRPGLVYEAGFNDYLGFLCDADPTVFADPEATCAALAAAGIATDASDLNLPSIGVGELVGSQTITRTVKAVANGTNRYDAVVEAPAGFDVTVTPSSFTVARNRTVTYTVTIENDGSADLGEWAFGSLTWKSRNGNFEVRSPIALRAFEFAAPDEIVGTGTDGSASFDVQFGYDGAYTAGAHGLVAANMTEGNVVDDPANDINTALQTGVGITVHEIDVPADTAHARFSLFDDFTDGNDDLDLYVFDPDGNFVGGSGSGTSAEQVDVPSPVAGGYFVVVHGWQTDGPDANYTLFDWSIPLATGGSLVIDGAPTTATLGGSGTVDVSWSGLTAGTKYLGAVSHSSDSGLLGLTLVRVDA